MATAPLSPAGLSDFLVRLFARCLDIRAVWTLVDADARGAALPCAHTLLIFANVATLHNLRMSDDLRRANIELLVVFDGDRFENAWGPSGPSGSLGRWAWRQVSEDLAYYDESRWAGREGSGAVARVRRKAVRVWRAPAG